MLKVWVSQVYMHGRTTPYYGHYYSHEFLHHTTTCILSTAPPPYAAYIVDDPLSLSLPFPTLLALPPTSHVIFLLVSQSAFSATAYYRVCLSFIRLDSAVAGFRCVICSLPISYYHHLVYINGATYIWVSPV